MLYASVGSIIFQLHAQWNLVGNTARYDCSGSKAKNITSPLHTAYVWLIFIIALLIPKLDKRYQNSCLRINQHLFLLFNTSWPDQISHNKSQQQTLLIKTTFSSVHYSHFAPRWVRKEVLHAVQLDSWVMSDWSLDEGPLLAVLPFGFWFKTLKPWQIRAEVLNSSHFQ